VTSLVREAGLPGGCADPTAAIRAAIEAELARSLKALEFPVVARNRQGGIWTLVVDVGRGDGPLDEAYEGASAGWERQDGAHGGAAIVLAVEPADERLHLRNASTPPPVTGRRIKIYPPRFLEALLRAYRDEDWSRRCAEFLAERLAVAPPAFHAPRPDAFPWLRARQAAAFALLRRRTSFLFGPPGTGKTRTVGALAARYLVEFKTSRVLLLSTTNVAVDRALIAADSALAETAPFEPAAARARRFLRRGGRHFTASEYAGREHLLPLRDRNQLEGLVALERARPDLDDLGAFARWSEAIDAMRAALRVDAKEILDRSRLVALTCTRALFDLLLLRDRDPFDLVIFDEASQVSLAHAAALAPLGRRVLFAGDPSQLGPIVLSARREALEWLGRSAFDGAREDGDDAVFLNEQSRMARPINDAVSRVFYGGRLEVARECANDPAWLAARETPRGAIEVVSIASASAWSRVHRGPYREESVAAMVAHCREALRDRQPGELLVLVPFRAQRALLRDALRRAGISEVTVNTVHRGQGDERHTVLFDPVDGNGTWLFLSASDLRNPTLAAIARHAG
jgi:DNA replication ATP-dependent helicase Dna2